MDDNHKQILADSTKVIGKLHLLATFFEDDVIYKIYVRNRHSKSKRKSSIFICTFFVD